MYMYIHTHMAKTLMISNEVYDTLKKIKGEDSFSKVISNLLDKRKNSGKNIAKYYGVLKGDKEYGLIMKDLRKKWGEWTQKYA